MKLKPGKFLQESIKYDKVNQDNEETGYFEAEHLHQEIEQIRAGNRCVRELHGSEHKA